MLVGSDGTVRNRKKCSECGREFFGYDFNRCVPCRGYELPSAKQVMMRYPALTAHVICASLGYATPTRAAFIIRAYKYGLTDYCEWVYTYWNGDPEGAIRSAWIGRHTHEGFMADYDHARALVDRAITQDREPVFASWF